jgi:hypothetical protein
VFKYAGTYQKRDCEDPIIFGEMLVELKNQGMTQIQIAKELQRNRHMVGRYQKIGLWPDTLKQFVRENRECINNTAMIQAAIKYRNAEEIRAVFEDLTKSSSKRLKLISTEPKKSEDKLSKKKAPKKRADTPEKLNLNQFQIENGSLDTTPTLEPIESLLEIPRRVGKDKNSNETTNADMTISLGSKSPITEIPTVADDTHSSGRQRWTFFAYLSNDVSALCLIAMIGALSFILITFQIRAYAELPEFKGLQNLTAISVEVLLIVLSALAFSGKFIQRFAAVFLFLSLSTSTVYLLHRNSKYGELSQTDKLKGDEHKNTENDESIKAKKENINSLKTKIQLLMHQLDPKMPNTYAAKGENGNLRITRQEISVAETKVETLETELATMQKSIASKFSTDKQIKIVENDTYLNLILRVILLLSSAFLIHVILSRFEAFKHRKSPRTAI